MRYGYLDIFTDADQLEGLELSNFEKPEELHDYDIKPELQRYTFFMKYKLTSGKWNGWFVAEVFQGYPHPYLLIPPEDVICNK